MSDPQIWTLIGVFAATMFGVVGVVTTTFTRSMRSGFAAVGYRFDALEAGLTGRIDALDHRLTGQIESLDHRLTGQIESLDHRLSARIDTVEARLGTKIELLDRDISVIAKRVFPEEPS